MIYWLKATALIALSVLAPIKGILITVGILIFADLVLGLMAAHKRGENITTSAGWRRTLTKMTVYQTAVVTGFLMQTQILGDFAPVVNIVAGVIGAVEFKSILENATEVTGVDFKSVIRKLGSDNDTTPRRDGQ